MACTKLVKASKYRAQLAEQSAPCAFCKRNVDEETTYGKLYSIGRIHCHYFCALLSCCLIQKGKEEEGLFGFMYSDILAEIERSKKHRCSYCGVEGATLGCSVVKCKKQFHLPCGREKHAVSLFYGNYKSYCVAHAPKQQIPSAIMSKAKARLARLKNGSMESIKNLKKYSNADGEASCLEEELVCVICYEPVEGFPTTETFWPPCCARDAWFHRSCLQRMASSAGAHYLKCPLCNDKDTFSDEVLSQGYYIPDRDAAWELEQNAFSEMYSRPVQCRADECRCPRGRDYDADSGIWDVKLCVTCGNPGAHAACYTSEYYVCEVCTPVAPDQTRLAALDAVTLPSQNQNSQRQSQPIMPSRMSIRRTKPKSVLHTSPCSSQSITIKTETDSSAAKTNTDLSREDLNLKPPRHPETNPNGHKQLEHEPVYPLKLMKSPNKSPLKLKQGISNTKISPLKLIIPTTELSPLKLLKQGLNERTLSKEVEKMVISDSKLVQALILRFKKPKPLSVKRKIVGVILDEILARVPNGENVEELKNSPTKLMAPNKDVSINENESNTSSTTMNATSNILEENTVSLTPNDTFVKQDENISKNPEKILEISERVSESPEIVSAIPEQIAEIPEHIAEIRTQDKLDIIESISEISENITSDIETQELVSEIPKHSESIDENYIKEVDICENANLTPRKPEIVDESRSSSTNSSPFQLPREFIADSSNSLPSITYTPKKLKKINIQNDSMEISENNQIVNIDLVKVENDGLNDFKVPDKKIKISPINEDVLEKNLDIDLESFKHHYLSEVDRKLSCKLEDKDANIATILKIPLDVIKKPSKRKQPTSENVARKRRKTTKIAGKNEKQYRDCNGIDGTKAKSKTEKIKNERGSDEKRRYRKIENRSRSKQFNVDEENTDNGNTFEKYDNESQYEDCIVVDDIEIEQNTEKSMNKRDEKGSQYEDCIVVDDIEIEQNTEKSMNKRDKKGYRKRRNLSRNKQEFMDKEGNEKRRRNRQDVMDKEDNDKRRRNRHDKVEKSRKRRNDVEKREREKRRHKKENTELSIRNRNISLKIRFKSEELNLKISKPKKKGRQMKRETPKVFKQYVLKYTTDYTSPKDCISRPEADVTPVKRKYNFKTEKTSDNLKQTSIANFFKVSPKIE